MNISSVVILQHKKEKEIKYCIAFFFWRVEVNCQQAQNHSNSMKSTCIQMKLHFDLKNLF